MTVKEFSDSFDTMLNSYASKGVFGDQASDTEVVLDEYEKSVLLTQAQDNVIKSYFERHTNELGQGFDDSSRRQVDFSSLIKVATLHPWGDNSNAFDNRGIIYKLPVSRAEDGSDYSRVLYILNEALIGHVGSDHATFNIGDGSTIDTRQTISITNASNSKLLQVVIVTDPEITGVTATYTPENNSSYAKLVVVIGKNTAAAAVKTEIESKLTGDHSECTVSVSGTPNFTAVHQLASTLETSGYSNNLRNTERYVIIPINYREYDREMSKAYSQPLKKQAWRLFQNISTGYDIYSELIPIWNVDTTALTYKVRYVERPTPIVLVDMPNGITVDGYSHQAGCVLNPIIHPEILKEAVRLAIESRASAVSRAEAYRNQAQKRNS